MKTREMGPQGCGITGFIPTVIQGNPLFKWGVSLREALFVVSQKWSFPAALNGASHEISMSVQRL